MSNVIPFPLTSSPDMQREVEIWLDYSDDKLPAEVTKNLCIAEIMRRHPRLSRTAALQLYERACEVVFSPLPTAEDDPSWTPPF